MRRSSLLAILVVAVPLGLAPARANAQQDVQVAATAFAEGQQAQLRGDFVRAAELFEIADQSVPSAAALRSAIRMRGAASQGMRAATLALQALQRYPEDEETRAVAQGALDRFSPQLTRVTLRCNEPCTATVDAALVGSGPLASMEFFVQPGPHVIRASWPERDPVSRSIQAGAGESLILALEAPPARPPAAVPTAEPAVAPAPPPPPVLSPEPLRPIYRSRSSGVSPAVFWIGTALTAGAGALTWWSGKETLSARDEYEENPTRKGYEDGVDLERRTNLLIGATALLGATTIGIGLFATDWGGSSELGLHLSPNQASVALGGRLP
jgi:hypothetical protein